MKPGARRLDSLTGLRFFAALAVVIYHLPLFCGVAFYGQRAAPWGYLGVQFFFVLSGFVLVWTARAGDTPTAFWRRRLARVYPLYLVMFLPGVVLALIGRASEPVSAGAVALSLPMLQAWVPAGVSGLVLHNANAPSWSLSNEAFFYAVFPLAMLSLGKLGAAAPLRSGLPRSAPSRSGPLHSALLRAGAAVVAVMVVVFLVLSAIGHGVPSLYYFPGFQLGFFLSGMLLGQAVRRGLTAPPLGLSVAALAAFAVAVVILGHHGVALMAKPAFVELLALPFIAVLIASAARSDLRGRSSPFADRRLVKLGVWSYALYLVQYPCFLIIRAIWPGGLSRRQSVGSLEALAVLVGLIAVAALAHHWIEAPWNERLRHAPAASITEPDELAPA
jgi:peptidoglycan/LPS O-acetylase OafA/YrhL